MTFIKFRILLHQSAYGKKTKDEELKLSSKIKNFLEESLNKDIFCFGTYVDDKLVSICFLTIFKFFPKLVDMSCMVGYINGAYTLEDYRKQGYFRKCFDACIKKGEDMGIIRFKLSTSNMAIDKMCKALGFIDDVNERKWSNYKN